MRLPVTRSRLPGALGEQQSLSEADVRQRREQFGDNVILEVRRRSPWERARETAADPMLWLLLGSGGVYFALGEVVEGATLLLAVLPLTGMDAFLHHRTRASTEGLEARLASRAVVLRDGREQEIPAKDIVVGDLALVRVGEIVPADGVLVSTAEGLQVEESSLTGEAYPVRKEALGLLPPGEAPLVESIHWGLAGTRALSGHGRIRVLRTGKETLYGEIVRSAALGSQGRTPLQAAIGELVAVLAAIAAVLCLVLALVRWQQGHGVVDALVSAATLAVAALPEEFPVAFTFFLGAGIYRLAQRQALVRRAVSVENIGRVTTVCSDKTGTITEGRLAITHVEPAPPRPAEDLLRVAALASREEGADPLDVAIFAEARRRGVEPRTSERVAVFPFTEERRRETAVYREGGSLFVATKGIPELVLELCGMQEPERKEWLLRIEALAHAGGKPIACASQVFAPAEWRGGEPTSGFSFAGLIVCDDPIRKGVREAVGACQGADLRTILVTGDHPATAASVARAIGLGGGTPRVVLGDELEELLAKGGQALREMDVVARASPPQKLALVRALQQIGETVAVTGDGVNDVPALQAADVGVAMGERGTRSAREVASIVLLDDNFRTIVRAIAEGRQLFDNLRACFEYLLLIHVPLVFTAAFIPLAGYPLLYLPIHIVWLELLIHPTALLAFQSAAPSDRLLPLPRVRKARFFAARDWLVIAASGALTTAALTAGYLYSVSEQGNEAHGRAMAIATLVVASAAFCSVLTRLRTFASRAVVGATLLASVSLIQIPALARLLHVEPLHPQDWGLAVLGSVIACVPLIVSRMLPPVATVRLREARR